MGLCGDPEFELKIEDGDSEKAKQALLTLS